jgi:hypothetical protein
MAVDVSHPPGLGALQVCPLLAGALLLYLVARHGAEKPSDEAPGRGGQVQFARDRGQGGAVPVSQCDELLQLSRAAVQPVGGPRHNRIHLG